MVNILYIITIIGAVIGGFTFVANLGRAQSAPQEAALAAVSMAWVVIPYCLARAAQLFGQREREKDGNYKELLISIDASLKNLLQTELAKKKERDVKEFDLSD